MAEETKIIRIFISSPSDVSEDREAAQRVINELNRTFCEHQGLILFPLTWEHNTYPAVGDYSQDVINQQIGDYDIFVGIMANRFGSPTQKAESGTEEEFNIAYENRRNRHIMFFFNNKPVNPYSLDLEQLAKVKSFKEKLSKQGVLYREFSADFERVFRESLTQCLNKEYLDKDKGKKADTKATPKTTQLKIDIKKYHDRMYEKYLFVNTLVFRNSQRSLKDIYVAQTLVKETHIKGGHKVKAKITKFPVKLIKKYKKILITDTAGMGKSTIMKRMFIDLIDNGYDDVGTPIYIELNKLKKSHSILEEINDELCFSSRRFDNDLLLKYISDGGFVFFLDGYDEISIADRTEATRDIQSFISKAGSDNLFFLTSRPEDSLSSFGDFQSFIIEPLTKKEAFELLKKYDPDKGKERSKKLIELLNSGQYNSIEEYLKNPLLVSLLYAAFDHKQTIPLKKHLFYRQVYEAYFDSHDLNKGINAHQKRSGLDIDDFNCVLRYIGYSCLKKVGVKFDKETILKEIKNAKSVCANSNFKESYFLYDMLSAVPLFIKDGTDYKWAHKSLMEYFAARFIAEDTKEKQDRILETIYNSDFIEKFINMLDLYCEIDPKGFHKSIRYRLCKDFVSYYESISYRSKVIPNELIDERVSRLFGYKPTIIRTTDKNELPNSYHEIIYNPDDAYNLYDGFSMYTSLSTAVFHRYLPYSRILGLLYHHSSGLFKESKYKLKYDDIGVLIDKHIVKGKVYRIEVKTGASSKERYALINHMISRRYSRILGQNAYLDYNACKKLVKDFDKNLTRNDIDNELFDGL